MKLTFFLLASFLFLFINNSHAQNSRETIDSVSSKPTNKKRKTSSEAQSLLGTTKIDNRTSIYLSTFGNVGFKSFPTGFVSSTGEDVTIAGGSGGALELGIGHSVTNRIMFTGSFQWIYGSPEFDNATYEMEVLAFQGIVKYKLTPKPLQGWSIGFGQNYMTNIKINIDATKLQNGDHTIFKYYNSVSPVILFSYHYDFLERVGFIFDTSLFFNKYLLSTVTTNGVNTSTSSLSQQTKDSYLKIDAAGIGLRVGAIFRF